MDRTYHEYVVGTVEQIRLNDALEITAHSISEGEDGSTIFTYNGEEVARVYPGNGLVITRKNF